MAHLYTPHRVGRGKNSTRRNFFSDDVEQTELAKKNELEDEIEFRKKYGHYFDSRDLKKMLHKKKTSPIEFENFIMSDPEVQIRLDVMKQNEVRKQQLILQGQLNMKKIFDQYKPENFTTDDEGIQHFKAEDIPAINDFNDNFIKFNSVTKHYTKDLEDRTVEDHRNNIIHTRRERENPNVAKVEFENLEKGYTNIVKKSEKELKVLETKVADTVDPVAKKQYSTRLDDVKNYLTDYKTRLGVISDITNNRFQTVEFGSNAWFDQNKNDLTTFNQKYNLDKYEKVNFKFTHGVNNHKVCYIPSGGGKSTLERNFSQWLFDLDNLLDYESDKDKFKYLVGYSRYFNKWNIINNYWKEMINMYEYKFRGKVLLAHGPQQLPDGMLQDPNNQSLIILPSVKRWDLREFKNNFEYLKSINDLVKVSLHYRYYFYIIFNYFNLDYDSTTQIKLN